MIPPKIVYLNTAKESLFKLKIEKAWIFASFYRLAEVSLIGKLFYRQNDCNIMLIMLQHPANKHHTTHMRRAFTVLTEERTRTDQSKVKKALVTAGIILLAILLSVGASILACKKSASTVKDGLSAYEIAQAYGYEGTVQDWLASLNGKSAYEIAKESGYTGTESDFSASLAANAKGDAVSIKSASFNQAGELILLLSDGSSLNVGRAVGATGADGKNGTDGADGKDGANGSAGVSIINAKVNEKGQLLLAFSDGKTINLDKITGTNGQDGIGITNSEINANGELVLTYSNGQTANLGTVIGAKGEKGDTGAAGTQGEKGAAGVSVSAASINGSGNLILTYSDGKVADLGKVIGARGEKGDTGAAGVQGEKGDKGDTGATGAQGEQGIQGEKGDKGDAGSRRCQRDFRRDQQSGRAGADFLQQPAGKCRLCHGCRRCAG